MTIQAQILQLLKKLSVEEKMNIILITHDLGVVASLARKIAVMYGGLIMEQGTTEEIFYHPAHPYTRALLHAIPKCESGCSERLEPIPGHALHWQILRRMPFCYQMFLCLPGVQKRNSEDETIF